LDPFCRSHDHRNLFVIDASFLPSSAAVNPALTIAAQALRASDHMLNADFGIREIRASGRQATHPRSLSPSGANKFGP